MKKLKNKERQIKQAKNSFKGKLRFKKILKEKNRAISGCSS